MIPNRILKFLRFFFCTADEIRTFFNNNLPLKQKKYLANTYNLINT